MFFILKGEERATCDGKTVQIRAGDSLLLPPTDIHLIENTGSRLYALCIMVPNEDEDFAELIRSGIPAELDKEDNLILRDSSAPFSTKLRIK